MNAKLTDNEKYLIEIVMKIKKEVRIMTEPNVDTNDYCEARDRLTVLLDEPIILKS